MEIVESPFPGASKPQAVPQPEPVKPHDVIFNADLLTSKFWITIQSTLAAQIEKGRLSAIGMGVYGCSNSDLADLKTALDKALSTFGTKNL